MKMDQVDGVLYEPPHEPSSPLYPRKDEQVEAEPTSRRVDYRSATFFNWEIEIAWVREKKGLIPTRGPRICLAYGLIGCSDHPQLGLSSEGLRYWVSVREDIQPTSTEIKGTESL
jgi:hypothetical protein